MKSADADRPAANVEQLGRGLTIATVRRSTGTARVIDVAVWSGRPRGRSSRSDLLRRSASLGIEPDRSDMLAEADATRRRRRPPGHRVGSWPRGRHRRSLRLPQRDGRVDVRPVVPTGPSASWRRGGRRRCWSGRRAGRRRRTTSMPDRLPGNCDPTIADPSRRGLRAHCAAVSSPTIASRSRRAMAAVRSVRGRSRAHAGSVMPAPCTLPAART